MTLDHRDTQEHTDLPLSFEEAVRFLESRINFETSISFSTKKFEKRLGHLRELLTFLGHPEKQYRTVHVAGTKGKGSTCALLSGILQSAGYRVGCFFSPHLYSLLERFTVDGKICQPNDFARVLHSLRTKLAAYHPTLFDELTYFEWITLFAFVYFMQMKVDYVILEVGLGGRFDATNVCDPCLTVITSISFDHMEQLGPTLAEIAFEKGGIIKPHIPLVASVDSPEAQQVLRQIAQTQKADAYFLKENFHLAHSHPPKETQNSFDFFAKKPEFPQSWKIKDLQLTLDGEHQCHNAALAIAGALLLRHYENARIDEQEIRDALPAVTIPIRVEFFHPFEGAPHFVVDGAHNRASVKAFIDTVRQKLPGKRMILVFGTTLGKDIEGMLIELLPHFDRIILTQHSNNPRRFPPQGLKTIMASLPNAPLSIVEEFFMNDVDPEELSQMIDVELPRSDGSVQVELEPDDRKALEKAWSLAGPDDVVCVTGSMYLAAELRDVFVREILHESSLSVNGD